MQRERIVWEVRSQGVKRQLRDLKLSNKGTGARVRYVRHVGLFYPRVGDGKSRPNRTVGTGEGTDETATSIMRVFEAD